MDELKNVTTENIKDKLYDCLQSTFETIEVVKKDLSQIYEGVANDLDIMRANNSDYTKGVQEGLNSIGCEVEKAYNKGLNDAWELARKIFTTDCATLQKVLGHSDEGQIIMTIEPQEALAKLEAYEKANEIKVGNVVEATDFCGDVFKGTVLDFKDGAETEVFVLDENGCVDVWKIADCKKTGKHIEINNILEQIRGD